MGASEPDLLTVEEVAQYLRVKRSSVYEWAQAGKIPAAKIGRLWRFHRGEIEAWVRRGGLQGPRRKAQGKGNVKKSAS